MLCFFLGFGVSTTAPALTEFKMSLRAQPSSKPRYRTRRKKCLINPDENPVSKPALNQVSKINREAGGQGEFSVGLAARRDVASQPVT
jgi:hypothetical protein